MKLPEIQSPLKVAPLVLFALFTIVSCNSSNKSEKYERIGRLEKFDEALDEIINSGAQAEILGQGFEWSEGPLWLEESRKLIFSDVPTNTIYQWTEAEGISEYLKPSGYTDAEERGGEMGSNGLLLDLDGNLILCQHGNRQMARMRAPIGDPKPDFVAIASEFNGLKFNSPNDAVFAPNGDLYFTDPPYGLVNQMDDETKEIDFQGVYKVDRTGKVTLISDQLTRPNGIGILADGSGLIVANSDSNLPNWYVIRRSGDQYSEPEIFYSLEGYDKKMPGLPDGLVLDAKGNIIATGPGGVFFFSSSGKLLGKYHLPDPASNCTLSSDGSTLYITNNDKIVRLKLI